MLPDPTPTPAPASEPPAPPPPAKVDLQALAEKVYALLKSELRLERERRGQTR